MGRGSEGAVPSWWLRLHFNSPSQASGPSLLDAIDVEVCCVAAAVCSAAVDIASVAPTNYLLDCCLQVTLL